MVKLADNEGVSLNQFAMYVLTTKVTELETIAFFAAERNSLSSAEIRADFDRVMEKLKQRPTPDDTPEWDKMPEI